MSALVVQVLGVGETGIYLGGGGHFPRLPLYLSAAPGQQHPPVSVASDFWLQHYQGGEASSAGRDVLQLRPRSLQVLRKLQPVTQRTAAHAKVRAKAGAGVSSLPLHIPTHGQFLPFIHPSNSPSSMQLVKSEDAHTHKHTHACLKKHMQAHLHPPAHAKSSFDCWSSAHYQMGFGCNNGGQQRRCRL